MAEIRSAGSQGAGEVRHGLFSRLLWVGVGFGLMMIGFALALSVFLIFIGVPLFVLGLALMESQAR